MMRRHIRAYVKYIVYGLLCSGLLAGIVFLNRSCPIITGYCAKSMCSEVFLAGRKPADISREDLGFFPVSLASCTVNHTDSTVSASLLGCWKRTAVFRRGLGSTLLNGVSKDSLRTQGKNFFKWTPGSNDTTDWPLGDRLAGYAPGGVNKNKLLAAVSDFFNEPVDGPRKNTRALLVVYKGQIIAEQYAKGFDLHSMFLGWSMAKSIGSTLMGILQKNDSFAVNDPFQLALWRRGGEDRRQSISIKNVLQQASGLDFDENYAKNSDVTAMLYKTGDMGNFTAAHPLVHTPGSFFNYSSGNANMLSVFLRERLGESQYHEFPYKELFRKTGMTHTLLEKDASGAFILSSYVYASARDWARFGLLYLNKGWCNGEQVIDSVWIAASVQPSSTLNFNHYGYQFWLNRGNDSAAVFRAYLKAPADMFYAGGFQGQNLFIIPSKQLLVVRLGMSEKADYGAGRSLDLLMNAID